LCPRNPAEVDVPSQPTQVSKQLFAFGGDREVESFPDAPSATELIYYQVGISVDGSSSGRARTQVFQDVEDTGIFRQIVGHGTALASDPVLLHEDGTSIVLDHHSEAGSSSGIDRFTGSIEPGKIVIHTAFSSWRRKGRGERGGGRGGRGWRWGEYIRIPHHSFPDRIVMNSWHGIVPGRGLIMEIYWNPSLRHGLSSRLQNSTLIPSWLN